MPFLPPNQQRQSTESTWRILWNNLFGGGDAGSRYLYRSYLFSLVMLFLVISILFDILFVNCYVSCLLLVVETKIAKSDNTVRYL